MREAGCGVAWRKVDKRGGTINGQSAAIDNERLQLESLGGAFTLSTRLFTCNQNSLYYIYIFFLASLPTSLFALQMFIDLAFCPTVPLSHCIGVFAQPARSK